MYDAVMYRQGCHLVTGDAADVDDDDDDNEAEDENARMERRWWDKERNAFMCSLYSGSECSYTNI